MHNQGLGPLWTIVLIAVVLACVQAQRTPPDYRVLQFSKSQSQLSVFANYQNETFQDQYLFFMFLRQNSQSIVQLDFQYQVNDGQNHTQLQFQLYIDAIIEFNSTDATPYKANQPYVSRYPKYNQNVQWQGIVNETTVVDGIPVYVFSCTTGVLTVRVHLSPQDVSTVDGPLTPNDVKIDIEIHEYPFVGDQTRLALKTTLKSQTQSQNSGGNAMQDNSLLFGNNNSSFPFGSFSWVPTAVGNGTVNVVATTNQINYGNNFEIYFSFLTDPVALHSDIVWDPKFGLEYEFVPEVPISNPQFCVGVACAAGAVVLVVVIVAASMIAIVLGVCVLMRKRHSYVPIS